MSFRQPIFTHLHLWEHIDCGYAFVLALEKPVLKMLWPWLSKDKMLQENGTVVKMLQFQLNSNFKVHSSKAILLSGPTSVSRL